MPDGPVLSLLLNVPISVISVYLLKTFTNIFFKRCQWNLLNIAAWSMWFIWQMVISTIKFSATTNIIVTILLTLAVCFYSYKGNIWIKVVFSISFNAIWMLIETLCGYFFVFINIDYRVPQLLGSIVSKLLFLIIILALKRVFSEEDIKGLPSYYSMVLLIIPCGSIFVVNNTFYMSSVSSIYSLKNTVSAIIVSMIMLFINIIIFNVYIQLASQLELKRCNTVYEQQLNMYEHNLLLRDTEYLKFRKERHNFKNQLVSIIEYAQNEEYDRIINFAKERILDNSIPHHQIAKTENSVIDTLINYKYSIAVQKSVEFTADLQLPIKLPYHSSDLCILLGNALDNALEAVDNQEIGNKYISVKIRCDKDNLKICIKNSFNGYLLKDRDGNLKTIKEDAQNHGIGIYSIMKAASKYRGTATFNNTESEFCVKILLYNPENENIT